MGLSREDLKEIRDRHLVRQGDVGVCDIEYYLEEVRYDVDRLLAEIKSLDNKISRLQLADGAYKDGYKAGLVDSKNRVDDAMSELLTKQEKKEKAKCKK